MTQLPDHCYIYRPKLQSGRYVGIIRRGESGVFDTDYEIDTPDLAKEFVERMNRKLGVTAEMQNCMEIGSMFGWHVPGAQLKQEAHCVFDRYYDDDNIVDA